MGTPAPRVSIVINNYNYGRFLPWAIESALAQEHSSFEVVVVDDGSTDDSAAVIERYGGRIVAVRKPNGGQGSAINAGFERSRGQFVLFLDADDLLLPTAAARVEAALSGPGVAKVHWPMVVVDADGRRTRRLLPQGRLVEGDLRGAALRDGPTNHLSAPTSGNGFHREFLSRVLPMDEPLFRQGADTFLFELAPFFGTIARLEEPQSLYRLHGSNFYGKMTPRQKLARHLRFYEHICAWLTAHLAAQGVEPDLERWHREGWWRRLAQAVEELESLPGSAPLIIAYDGTCEVGELGGRPCLPFTERAGAYAGPPADDRHAIDELERLRRTGAEALAFLWPTFWYLDYYDGLKRHLSLNYQCVLQNERLVVFDLRDRRAAAPDATRGA